MNLNDIKDFARKSANQQEFETHRDEWHSHYYGFILGMQKALELHHVEGQSTPQQKTMSNQIIKAIEMEQKKALKGLRFHEKNGDKYGLALFFEGERKALRKAKRIVKNHQENSNE